MTDECEFLIQDLFPVPKPETEQERNARFKEELKRFFADVPDDEWELVYD